MKIEGPNRTSSSAPAKKKEGAGGGSRAEFDALIGGGAQSASESAPAQSIARVDALLAAQGVEDPTEGASKRRMRHRSQTVLDELEKIRLSMLAGTLTVGHMIDIADVVASHREKILDPELTAIMDEIDLRAQVELAKMRMSLDARGA